MHEQISLTPDLISFVAPSPALFLINAYKSKLVKSCHIWTRNQVHDGKIYLSKFSTKKTSFIFQRQYVVDSMFSSRACLSITISANSIPHEPVQLEKSFTKKKIFLYLIMHLFSVVREDLKYSFF